MKKGYIFANTKITLRSLKEYLGVLPDVDIVGSLHLSMAEEILLSEKPDLIFLSDEFLKEECIAFLNKFENTQLFETTSIIYIEFEHKESMLEWLLEEKRIDFWLEFSNTVAERKFIIERAIERKKDKKLLYKSQMQNEYLQSVLANYERKSRYQQKANEDKHILELTKFMQTIRQHLTGIDGSISLLINPSVELEERKKTTQVLSQSIRKLKEFLDQENLSLEEKKVAKASIKITSVSKIITSMKQKITFQAEEKDIKIKFVISNPNHIIVGRREDFLFVMESIVSEFLKILTGGCTLYVKAHSIESSPLVKFALEVDPYYLSQEDLVSAFGKENVSRRMLDSIGAQFEFINTSEKRGIIFYLPRLGS